MVNEVRIRGLKHQKEKRSMDYFVGLDDAGKIVREARVASEPEALLQVLTNTIYRFKRIGLEAGGFTAFSPKRACRWSALRRGT